jgi:uncharacterized SAM-binding protein YcdF (DUF218 family)
LVKAIARPAPFFDIIFAVMNDLTENRDGAERTAHDSHEPPPAAPERSTRKRGRSRLWRAGLPVIAVVCLILLVGGFVAFAEQIAHTLPPADPHADAIVVLTGGSARIDGALQLLSEGRASRLLISGVDPKVSAHALADTVDSNLRDDLDCCADLGHDAIDTIGNAAETRRWAKDNGFTSLIVVTSDYHMPRSMTELSGAMPDIELIPFPVSNPALRFADWWHNPPTFALLVREYGKYLVANARRLVPITNQASAGTGAAAD